MSFGALGPLQVPKCIFKGPFGGQFGDYYVKFMKEDNGMYKFTMPEDKCWVKTCDVISILSQPEIKCARPIKYSFPSNEIMHLQKVIRSRKSD